MSKLLTKKYFFLEFLVFESFLFYSRDQFAQYSIFSENSSRSEKYFLILDTNQSFIEEWSESRGLYEMSREGKSTKPIDDLLDLFF